MHQLIAQQAATLPVQMMCALAGIPRSGYYRFLHRPSVGESPEEVVVRARIHNICLQYGFYGYRRVAEELRRAGFCVNHKRILRLMRTDNLLCVRKRRWMMRTTNSAHSYRVYPNLAAEVVLTEPNRLWVADITYIRLRREFIYLAAILDAFSRRVVGCALVATSTRN
jgi:transposase InsO family protein